MNCRQNVLYDLQKKKITHGQQSKSQSCRKMMGKNQVDLYREGMRGFGRAYMCPCSFHSVFYNGTSNIATVFVEVRLVDDVRRVGGSVDVLRSTRVVPIRHFITRPSRSNSLIGYAWFVWIIISLHTLPGLCRPSIRCTW